MKRIPPLPTPAHLQRAHARLQRKPGWPASFDAAMQDPVRSRLISGLARGLALFDQLMRERREATPPPAPPAPPTLRQRYPTFPPLPRITFDQKRVASNDTDD